MIDWAESLYRSSHDAICSVDESGRFLGANPAFERLTGYSLKRLRRMRFLELIPPEQVPSCLEAFQKLMRTGVGARLEKEYVRSDGMRVPVDMRTFVVRDARRKTLGYAAIVRDVSDTRDVEERLRESVRYWRTLLERTPEAVTCLDLHGRIFYINRDGVEEKRKFEGKSVFEFLHPLVHDEYRRTMEKVIRTRKPIRFQTSALSPKGGYAWFDACMGPLVHGGRIEGLVVTSSDSTQKALTTARLEGIFKSSKDAIGFTDFDGNLVEVNEAFLRMTGYRRQDVIGQMRLDFLAPAEFAAAARNAVKRLRASHVPIEVETEWVRKDGTRLPVQLSSFVVQGPDRKPIGMASMARDISERRSLERDILEAGAREQVKLGHELHDTLGQTLTGLSLLSKTLRGRLARLGASEAAQVRRLASLSSLAVRQARNLARGLPPGSLGSEEGGFVDSVRALADEVAELFGLDCRVACQDAFVLRDRTRALQLYRIIQESLHNAVKHARAGVIRVRIAMRSGQLVLSISDDGRGISSRRARKYGLGLRIMEHRARLLGGRLTVSASKGGGTTVACVCPLA